VAFAACGAVLATAAWLSPSPAGLGTHRQLGFPPCTLVAMTGYPCPTCGMTTAFAYTVRGRCLSAIAAQPAGFALALTTMAAAGLSLSVVVTGRSLRLNWYRIRPVWITAALLGFILLGWAAKVSVGMIRGTLPVPAERRFAGSRPSRPGPPAAGRLPLGIGGTDERHGSA